LFSARPDIETAWVIHVAPAGRADEAHPLIGVETGGDWPSLMQAVQAAVKASVPDMVFDIQRVDRRNPGGLTSALIQAAPFYVRGANTPTLN
ncbi:MAG TPA: enhanced serine sensitivity protein SseB C-terminal domain-containing protein, partial [Rhizomicrobium sp.]|nr:enhanced serine sensitivity protein SseB C-terminal domain-containing protein [Rhizomicrobium sp.]